MSLRNGLSGGQIVGIALVVLFLATACCVIGLAIGGAIGYAIGRDQPAPVQPPIELPQPPGEEGGPPMRPYLGVRYEMVEDGALIVAVEPNTPADEAGLREGDVILAVDGQSVGEGAPSLAVRILSRDPGDEIVLRVQRDDETLELEATLGMRLAIE